MRITGQIICRDGRCSLESEPERICKLFSGLGSSSSGMIKVICDVGEDIQQIPGFSVLKTERGLFENVRLDESRTCVYWSDRVELPSDSLLEYGQRVD